MDVVEAHHAVVEQVCLYHGSCPYGGCCTDVAEVGFGEPVAFDPRARPDVDSEKAKACIHQAAAGAVLEEPRRCYYLNEGVLEFVEPDEPAPQGVVAWAVTAHRAPFHRRGDRDG